MKYKVYFYDWGLLRNTDTFSTLEAAQQAGKAFVSEDLYSRSFTIEASE